MKKTKMPEQTQTPVDARTLSEEDYLKFRRDMRKDMRLKEYDEKLKRAFSDGQKDVRSMSSEEYAKWKQRMRGVVR